MPPLAATATATAAAAASAGSNCRNKQQPELPTGPKLEETPADKYLAAGPLALHGRVAQEEEVPRVVLEEEGDEKLREVARHVLIEGGLKPELFVELMEGLVVPDWHFEHM